jgi:hypothetical protein
MMSNWTPEELQALPILRVLRRRLDGPTKTRTAFLSQLGYQNMNKGLRRLDAFEKGDLSALDAFADELPGALGVTATEVNQALSESRQIQREQRRAREVRDFVPHAILKTTNRIPRPVFAAALINAPRRMRIDFQPGSHPVTYVSQVKSRLPEGVPTFGRVTGFFVNYTVDRSVEFDLKGRPIAEYADMVRVGQTSLAKRQPLSALIK